MRSIPTNLAMWSAGLPAGRSVCKDRGPLDKSSAVAEMGDRARAKWAEQ